MEQILNLTQHKASIDQSVEGVVDLPDGDRSDLCELLTFSTVPSRTILLDRAEAIARLARSHKARTAMIGGAPYLMGYLEIELRNLGITVLYSFSERVSEDQIQPDGSVRKVAIFKHVGWVR